MTAKSADFAATVTAKHYLAYSTVHTVSWAKHRDIESPLLAHSGILHTAFVQVMQLYSYQ